MSEKFEGQFVLTLKKVVFKIIHEKLSFRFKGKLFKEVISELFTYIGPDFWAYTGIENKKHEVVGVEAKCL